MIKTNFFFFLFFSSCAFASSDNAITLEYAGNFTWASDAFTLKPVGANENINDVLATHRRGFCITTTDPKGASYFASNDVTIVQRSFSDCKGKITWADLFAVIEKGQLTIFQHSSTTSIINGIRQSKIKNNLIVEINDTVKRDLQNLSPKLDDIERINPELNQRLVWESERISVKLLNVGRKRTAWNGFGFSTYIHLPSISPYKAVLEVNNASGRVIEIVPTTQFVASQHLFPTRYAPEFNTVRSAPNEIYQSNWSKPRTRTTDAEYQLHYDDIPALLNGEASFDLVFIEHTEGTPQYLFRAVITPQIEGEAEDYIRRYIRERKKAVTNENALKGFIYLCVLVSMFFVVKAANQGINRLKRYSKIKSKKARLSKERERIKQLEKSIREEEEIRAKVRSEINLKNTDEKAR